MQVLGSTVLLLLAFGWALAARNHPVPRQTS
jgi:hypothetical protein